MAIPHYKEVANALDKTSQIEINMALTALFKENGIEELVPLFIEAFPEIRHGQGRNAILFSLVRFARSRSEVVQLALSALNDSTYLVRMQAASALAYALREDAIPQLERLSTHRNQKTRDDALAAIDAIRHKNHHYYFDRKHTGKAFWTVNPEDRQKSLITK
jgi:alkylhydroperoxidase family enzyme